MESGIIAINANVSITIIVLCSVIIIAIIIIAIEIAFSIETIVTIELIIVSITVITLELGIMSAFANEAFHAIEMIIICRGCRGIRSAQWQGELDGPDVTGRDVSMLCVVHVACLSCIVPLPIIPIMLPLHVGFPAQSI
jgi:hypothetical protein